jgi:hypothetical protein
MTSSEFWLSLLSNSISTLFLGTIVALIISRVINSEEKKKDILEKSISKSKTTLAFLNTIEEEIKDIIVYFEVKKQYFFTPTSLQYLRFDTSYWEILKTSGEIPSFFEPIILQIFTNFYSKVSQCNLLYEQFITAEINNHAQIEKMIMNELNQNLHSLENNIKYINIELRLNQVIEKTKNNIKQQEDQLNKIKKPSRSKKY